MPFIQKRGGGREVLEREVNSKKVPFALFSLKEEREKFNGSSHSHGIHLGLSYASVSHSHSVRREEKGSKTKKKNILRDSSP
jgi:hypothetical protein